jgi:uncharacterized surface anchored protein
MKKFVNLFFGVLIIALSSVSCSDDKTTDPENSSRVILKLVDAEGVYDEVNVEIVDIQYNSSEEDTGWQSFTPEEGYPIQTDLTELIAGNELLLSDEVIPSGWMQQIRLVLSENNTLKLEGQEDLIPLKTPSAQQSGLKIKLNQELDPGFSYTFILDWDVQRSVVEAGNSGQYILKPVIRANAEVNSGSVSGIVVADLIGDESTELFPQEAVVVGIYNSEDEYVTETLTDAEGKFMVQGLSPGDYRIQIETLEYIPYVSPNPVSIEAGQVKNVGTIELQVPVN